MTMTYDTQMQINALMRDLISEGEEFFDPEKAMQLRELVPVERKKRASVKVQSTSSGSLFKGLTNTGASVGSDDDELKTVIDTQAKGYWVGQYRIYREEDGRDSIVEIEDRFLDTRESQDKRFSIHYADALPLTMMRAKVWTFRLGGLSMNIVRMRPWKQVDMAKVDATVAARDTVGRAHDAVTRP